MQTSTANNCNSSQALENRRLLQRILLDLLVFVVLIIPIIIYEFAIEPFRRGFFCDDETIRYPFRANTITPVLLGLLLALPPIIILTMGEYARQRSKGQIKTNEEIFGYPVRLWLVNCFKQWIYFGFGLLLTFDATEVGKYTIGRLRPHFWDVCQPQLKDGTTCSDAINQHRYIENYYCLGTGYTTDDIRQARLSFPSGHSSLSFYALVYMSLYLQKRMHWRRSHLTRHFIQFCLIMLAWFTALSRIMDNWHHWSDVLAGSLIGVVGALITANYISKFFKHKYETGFANLRLKGLARQDTSDTLNEVLEATPPPYTINQQPVNAFSNDTYCTKV